MAAQTPYKCRFTRRQLVPRRRSLQAMFRGEPQTEVGSSDLAVILITVSVNWQSNLLAKFREDTQ